MGPALRISTEYDSEPDENKVFTKISATVLDGVAKIKATFLDAFRSPVISLKSKGLEAAFAPEERDGFLSLEGDVNDNLKLKYTQYLKEGLGALTAVHKAGDVKTKLTYELPKRALTKAELTFPAGEVRYLEEPSSDTPSGISGFGIMRTLNGVLLADFVLPSENEPASLTAKYTYKDDDITLSPSLSLPSRDLSLQFKRQFDPRNKLSFLYSFQSCQWTAVFKHKHGHWLKGKVGYDSANELAWACAWLTGDKDMLDFAPGKAKAQVMLQVPRNRQDICFLFKIKKKVELF